MKIIFDFDYTLFDTGKFHKAVVRVFTKHGLDEGQFLNTMEESKEGGREWKPYRQLEILKKGGLRAAYYIEKDFEALLEDTDKFMYADTEPFIESVKNHSLFLLTYGEDVLQSKKTKGSLLLGNHFNEVVITGNLYKDKEAHKLSEGGSAIFVEDNPYALSAAKKYAPHIITVRINRGEGRYTSEPSKKEVDYEIKKLDELRKIIEAQKI